MILYAAQFAQAAHGGQMRKYTNRPYIEHPMRVAGRVMLLPGVHQDVVAAAWLHDVMEDCPCQTVHLVAKFNAYVVKLVRELTNPSKGMDHLFRHERKQIDREHLATVSRWAKIIKLIDRIDNVNDMALADDKFKTLYAEESLLLIDALLKGVVGDRVIGELISELIAAIQHLQYLARQV